MTSGIRVNASVISKENSRQSGPAQQGQMRIWVGVNVMIPFGWVMGNPWVNRLIFGFGGLSCGNMLIRVVGGFLSYD